MSDERYTIYDGYFQPQVPGLVLPVAAAGRLDTTNVTLTLTANDSYFARYIMPKNGTLKDVCIYLGATAAGTGKFTVYDDTATTRTRLAQGSAVTLATANGWNNLGDPDIEVWAGQHVDIGVSISDASATIGNVDVGAAAQADLPADFLAAPGGASNQLLWMKASNASPAATQAESGFTNTDKYLLVICRVEASTT